MTTKPSNAPRLFTSTAVVLSASLVMLATLPGRSYGLGLITTRLLDEFPGLTESRFGWINAIAITIGAAACLPAGYLLDRFGTRRVLAVVMLALAGSVYAMTLSTNLAQLTVTLTLCRALGQSMLSVISLAMMGKWFGERASLSMGAFAVLMTMFLASAFGGLGEALQQTNDWRTVWRGLAWMLLSMTPIMLITALRPRKVKDETAVAKQADDLETGTSLNEALASRYFWAFALAMSLFAMAQAGVTLLLQPILEQRGISEQTYQAAQITALFTGLFANLLGGLLMKRIAMHHLLTAAMALLAIAMIGLALLDQAWQAYAQSAVFGLSGGLITVLFFAVWVRAFGRRELGKIQGAAQLLAVLGSALGPVILTQSLDLLDSYNAALFALAAGSLVLGGFAAATKMPQND